MGLRWAPGRCSSTSGSRPRGAGNPMRCAPCSSGLILVGMMIVQSDRPRPARGPVVSLHDLAVIGEQTYRSFVMIELTLILLVAPAVTAGAICLDKTRGTLDHMLVTDLSNAEIVLGKLAVRLIPVLGLIACVLPVTGLDGAAGWHRPAGDGRFVPVATAAPCSVAHWR